MFRIDLKRSASRKPVSTGTPRPGPEKSFLPVGVALIVLAAVLWVTGRVVERGIVRREAEAATLEATVGDARRRLAEVSGKRREMLAFAREEIYWSDQLRVLSRRLGDKLWVDRVTIVTAAEAKNARPSRRLAIEGGVLSGGNESNLDLIAGFVESLETDERFRSAFGDVRLGSVQRAGSDSTTLKFVLNASVRS